MKKKLFLSTYIQLMRIIYIIVSFLAAAAAAVVIIAIVVACIKNPLEN
jgi:hypothetical protein